MKYCTKCGAQLEDTAHFCQACGTNQESAGSHTAPPAANAAPARQKKKKLSGCAIAAIVLGALSALVLLFVGGLLLLVGFFTSDLVKATEDYLALLKKGEYRQAYEASAEGLRQETSFDRYQQVMGAFPILSQHTKYSVDSRNFENDEGSVEGELSDEAGNTAKVEFALVKKDGVWRVLSLHVTRGKSSDATPSDAAPSAATPLEAAWRNFQANIEGKMTAEVRKKQPEKIAIRLTRDGQSSDYVLVEKEKSGDTAVVVVGPEDSEADVVYYLRKADGGWQVDRIDSDPMP